MSITRTLPTSQPLTLLAVAVALLCSPGLQAAPAAADVTAYLVNVTMRPGYNFPNADAALNYGYGLCHKVSQGRSYADVMAEVRADYNTSDEYQASYLMSQAVNELCPALIWQLRESAAHYRAPLAVTTRPERTSP
jgi:hypothetical protein